MTAPHVQQLLDQLLDSHATPEEVCDCCPELLPEVRKQWRQISRVQADLDALFPPLAGPDTPLPALPGPGTDLPLIPGYEVEAVLGRGGMGIVYQTRHLRLGRPIALKMLLAGISAAPPERERFLREAEAAGLRHPNVVQVYYLGSEETHSAAQFCCVFSPKGAAVNSQGRQSLGRGRPPHRFVLSSAPTGRQEALPPRWG
jgi:serine/threonine-protein kinase